MAIDTSGLITVAQAAKRLRLSQEQVRRNLRDGKLRSQRVGNRWFVDEASLRAPSGDRLIPDDLLKSIEANKAAIVARGARLMTSDEIIDAIRP